MNERKYLPIGSVCTLKGKLKKVMVVGYYFVTYNGNLNIKDYSGVVYPEGFPLNEQVVAFNHDEIDKVDFIGYKDEDLKTFMKNFDEATGNVSSRNKDDYILTSSSSYSKLLFDENGVVMIAEPVEGDKSKPSVSNDAYTYTNPFVYDVNSDYLLESEKKPMNFKEDSKAVSADFLKKKHTELAQIKFDENGVVISDGVSDIDVPPVGPGLTKKEEPSYLDIPAIGPGLEQKKVEYKFDENGVIVADDVTDVDVPPVGPGLNDKKGKKTKYQFDENGIVISQH